MANSERVKLTYVSWDASPDEGEDPEYVLLFSSTAEVNGEYQYNAQPNQRDVEVYLYPDTLYHLIVLLKTGELPNGLPLFSRGAVKDFITPSQP